MAPPFESIVPDTRECDNGEEQATAPLERGGYEPPKGVTKTERELIKILGEEQLKSIGEQLADIVRQHDLQRSPDVCRKLFAYMSDVIDGWNSV